MNEATQKLTDAALAYEATVQVSSDARYVSKEAHGTDDYEDAELAYNTAKEAEYAALDVLIEAARDLATYVHGGKG